MGSRPPGKGLQRALRAISEPHWPGLPERYSQVLGQLLMQVESSALFTEESCSFSRGDLSDALGQWLAKARQVAPH